jgi:endonuclease/exonuclease/phosphatase (EEP) superfamily protein YafD
MLCWNVYKNNLKQAAFRPWLHSLVKQKKIELLLFQEASFESGGRFALSGFAYDAAANLEFAGAFYGVLTASSVESKRSRAYLSKSRESLIGPHKSLLLSRFSFADGSKLLVLNIHAINFRENQSYAKEIDGFMEYIKEYDGPLIVAGDFNSWNRERQLKIARERKALSLKSVPFKQKQKIKSFMGNTLDFIFYRGLELLESEVIDGHGLSDHNPLFASFRKISK